MMKKTLFLIIAICTVSLFAQTDDPVNQISQFYKDGNYQGIIEQVPGLIEKILLPKTQKP